MDPSPVHLRISYISVLEQGVLMNPDLIIDDVSGMVSTFYASRST